MSSGSSASIVRGGTILSRVPVVYTLVTHFRPSGRLSLLDLTLRASDCGVNFVANLIDGLASVEFVLDDFISLKETLQLR